jgi:hypothetical protein
LELNTIDPPSNTGLPIETVQRAKERNQLLRKSINALLDEEEAFPLEDYWMFYDKASRFRTSRQTGETFDSSMPSTGRILEIKQLMNKQKYELALPSMVEWTPANLVLNYIHRLLPGQISREDFHEFLTYCQTNKELFEFRRRGDGEVRTIETGWDPLPPRPKKKVKKLPNQREFRARIAELMEDIFAGNEELHDLDADIFFDRFERLTRGDKDGPISREAFDQGMAYLDYKDKKFV